MSDAANCKYWDSDGCYCVCGPACACGTDYPVVSRDAVAVVTPAKSGPVRIQRQRTKGWRMPPNTVSVTRPGKFGNPYFPGCGKGFGNVIDGQRFDWPLHSRADMVRHFREYLKLMRRDEPKRFDALAAELRGKNVACFCRGGDPCHGDVWLEMANGPICEVA